MTSDRPIPNTTTDLNQLAERFATPDFAGWGPVPIWWWSGAKLEGSRLRWQMEHLLSQGVAQAVIMNLAPTGPMYGALADDPPFMSEPWWGVFLGACEDARELGFRFWPYDQIGFSGANFQGRLVSQHPEWAGRTIGRLSVALTGETILEAPLGAIPVDAFTIVDGERGPAELWAGGARADDLLGELVLIYDQQAGFDYFSPEAVAALMDIVHGEYERRAGQYFGDVIVGIFQDELPNLPLWGHGFAKAFEREYGYDIAPRAGALWGDPIDGDVPGWRVRLDYERLRAGLGRTATFDQFAEWANRNGLLYGFDQQTPAREGDPDGSTLVYGDYLGTHDQFSAPGSDHWGDSKVHSSMAHAHGHPRVWIESFHSSGWGGTLEETYDWLSPYLRRGANLYNPHAVYYATPGGWWEWAPPSTCWRQPYWPDYRQFSGAVTRLSELFSGGIHIADTLLVYPVSTSQADTTLAGTGPDARRSAEAYHTLNGEPSWFNEKRGILERAGLDYDIQTEAVLASCVINGSRLRVGAELVTTVVLPAMHLIGSDAASVLLDFANAGGTVIAAGIAPTIVWGAEAGALESRLRAAVASGAINVLSDLDQVPAAVTRGPVWIEADAPLLLRRVADGYVIGLFAHDEITGTKAPITPGIDSDMLIHTDWSEYYESAHAVGYTFVPVDDRVAHVTMHGFGNVALERWNPRSGVRTAVTAIDLDGGARRIDLPFDDGSVTVLVARIGAADATIDSPSVGAIVAETTPQAWRLQAASTLDNQWGDMADRRRDGILPIEVWRLRSRDDAGQSRTVTAGFGPFALATGPFVGEQPWNAAHEWEKKHWSLSRGIENDPGVGRTLGPKGYVPEEFVDWRDAEAGQWYGISTTLNVPRAGLVLNVGANADGVILVDGIIATDDGDGYWRTARLPAGAVPVQLWWRTQYDEPLRATFAVVADQARFARAEWLEPDDGTRFATRFTVGTQFDLDTIPEDTRIQVGSEQPCVIVVNGIEVGRQSDFDPYSERRFARNSPYDIRDQLVGGTNTIELHSRDTGRIPALRLDSVPSALGGLGLLSGHGDAWVGAREEAPVGLLRRSRQWQDRRAGDLIARPHPLPGASWLEEPRDSEGVVVAVTPDLDPTDVAARVLTATLPLGSTRVQVPTELEFTARLNGAEVTVNGTIITFSQPTDLGAELELTYPAPGGRRDGALVESGLRVTTTEVEGPLRDWTELGLESLAGSVTYRTSVAVPEGTGRLVLDLGRVRGSVSVSVAGKAIGSQAFGPYRFEIDNEDASDSLDVEIVVRNTLAGYLAYASPTPGVFAGQSKAGLLGPVRVVRYDGE